MLPNQMGVAMDVARAVRERLLGYFGSLATNDRRVICPVQQTVSHTGILPTANSPTQKEVHIFRQRFRAFRSPAPKRAQPPGIERESTSGSF